MPLVYTEFVKIPWRAFFEHPQKQQAPDSRPIWLLVGTYLALGLEPNISL